MVDRNMVPRMLKGSVLYIGLAAVFVTGCLLSEEFLTMANQRDVLWQVSLNGILAVGMTLVILTAGIDLSVGSVLSLCTVVCAMLLMDREWTRATTLARSDSEPAASGSRSVTHTCSISSRAEAHPHLLLAHSATRCQPSVVKSS